MEMNLTGYLTFIRGVSAVLNNCETSDEVQEVYSGLTASAKGLCEMRLGQLQTENTEGDN